MTLIVVVLGWLASFVSQATTLAPGVVTNPVFLTASSTPSQYIAAGAGGSADGSLAQYNFTARGGAATIRELVFNVTASAGMPIASIKIGAHPAPAGNGRVHFQDLSLAVLEGGSGLTQNVFVSYSHVGVSGVPSGTTASIAISYVKYSADDGIERTICTVAAATELGIAPCTYLLAAPVAAPAMKVVGSKPILALSAEAIRKGGLFLGENLLIDLTIAAGPTGNVAINTIVFNSSPFGGVSFPAGSGNAFARLSIGSNALIGANCTVVAGNPVVTTCTLPKAYQLPAGSATTFKLFGTLGITPGAREGEPRITTSLAPADLFSWTDTAGSNPVAFTGDVGPNHTYLFNYPTQSRTLHN